MSKWKKKIRDSISYTLVIPAATAMMFMLFLCMKTLDKLVQYVDKSV